MAFTQEQWDALMAEFPPGTPVRGVVTGCQVFGVFVRLDEVPEVPALLEIIHFRVVETAPGHRIEFPADYPPVGDRVEARILGWCLRPKDVRLTQLSDLEWCHSRRPGAERSGCARAPGGGDRPIRPRTPATSCGSVSLAPFRSARISGIMDDVAGRNSMGGTGSKGWAGPAGHQGKDRLRMSFKHLCVDSLLRLVSSVAPARRAGHLARRRAGLRPCPEALETRLVLQGTPTTYTWSGLGDGTDFSDPNNWLHQTSYYGGGVGVPGVPTLGSNLYFPPVSQLPANSPTTINFNAFASFPAGLFTIAGSYTFTGNGVSVSGGIIVTNPPFGAAADATILLLTVSMGRQSTIYTQSNSTLNLGDAADLTGLRLTLQGGVTTGGGGQVVIDTQNILDPQSGFTLQTFEVAGGTVTLGTTMDFSNSLFQVDANSSLNVADDAAVKVGSLSGPGTVRPGGHHRGER